MAHSQEITTEFRKGYHKRDLTLYYFVRRVDHKSTYNNTHDNGLSTTMWFARIQNFYTTF